MNFEKGLVRKIKERSKNGFKEKKKKEAASKVLTAFWKCLDQNV